MLVFISWSGPRSLAVAEALHSWLRKVINALDPWLSSNDVGKGSRWNTQIAVRLEEAKAGIICLTPGNFARRLNSLRGWRTRKKRCERICLYAADWTGMVGRCVALAQFQHTKPTKDEILKMLTRGDNRNCSSLARWGGGRWKNERWTPCKAGDTPGSSGHIVV